MFWRGRIAFEGASDAGVEVHLCPPPDAEGACIGRVVPGAAAAGGSSGIAVMWPAGRLVRNLRLVRIHAENFNDVLKSLEKGVPHRNCVRTCES